jgi:N-acetylmuramoyl-L-alanine amidase
MLYPHSLLNLLNRSEMALFMHVHVNDASDEKTSYIATQVFFYGPAKRLVQN